MVADSIRASSRRRSVASQKFGAEIAGWDQFRVNMAIAARTGTAAMGEEATMTGLDLERAWRDDQGPADHGSFWPASQVSPRRKAV